MELALLGSTAAFLGVLLIVIGFYQARGGKSSAQRRLETLERYSAPQTEGAVPLALREQGSGWSERTRSQLERAGLALKLHEYVALRVLLALVAFVVVLALGNGHILAFLLGIVAGVVGYMLPAFYVRTRITRQVRKFNDQLADMLTMVANSLRAGFGLLQGLDLAAEQSQPPMSTELNHLLRDTRMGASIETALESMGERVGSYDMDVIITAILIQRSVGSNLSEVLEKVAHTIRERARIQGEINTLTAQKKLSGVVIGLMPPAVVLLMLAVNFSYMSALFTDPLGRFLLVVAIVLDIVGILAIKRIVSVDI
ncbi:MAG: type II secretion system F family protein [Chloroflexi bacterium]|nr:type II secretion system F family protein [Chloroflexota bacterium]